LPFQLSKSAWHPFEPDSAGKFLVIEALTRNKIENLLLELTASCDAHREKTMSKTRIMPATLALAATIAFAGPAFADKMKATLDGKSEVPPNTSAGTGTADVDFDPASKKLSWKLTYSGLTGPATAAHFHGPGEPGKNAGVAVAIPNATSSPAEGSATLTDAQAADLLAGKYYINVHTQANPGGEIRGQVTK
jgi:CHRD domain